MQIHTHSDGHTHTHTQQKETHTHMLLNTPTHTYTNRGPQNKVGPIVGVSVLIEPAYTDTLAHCIILKPLQCLPAHQEDYTGRRVMIHLVNEYPEVYLNTDIFSGAQL